MFLIIGNTTNTSMRSSYKSWGLLKQKKRTGLARWILKRDRFATCQFSCLRMASPNFCSTAACAAADQEFHLKLKLTIHAPGIVASADCRPAKIARTLDTTTTFAPVPSTLRILQEAGEVHHRVVGVRSSLGAARYWQIARPTFD